MLSRRQVAGGSLAFVDTRPILHYGIQSANGTSTWRDRVRSLRDVLSFGCYAILLFAGAFLLVQTLGMAARPAGYDLTAYTDAARALVQGTDPYRGSGHFPYWYPLFLAAALTPALLLPKLVLDVLWFLASLAAYVYAANAQLTWEEETTSGERADRCPRADRWPRAALLLLVSVVLFEPLQNNVRNGQVDLLLLAMMTAFAQAERRQQSARSGGWLGTAIAVKLVPIVFVLPLIRSGRGKALVWTAAACVATTVLLPTLFVGRDIVRFYTQSYPNAFLLDRVAGPASNDARFTLAAVIARAVPHASPLLIRLVATAVVLLVIARAVRAAGQSAAWGPRAFALYAVAIVLISPMSETHHLVMLTPAICSVVTIAARSQQARFPGYMVAVPATCVLIALLIGFGNGSRFAVPALFLLVALVTFGEAVERPAPKVTTALALPDS